MQQGLPPIKVLLASSWHRLVKAILPLIILSIISLAILGITIIILSIPLLFIAGSRITQIFGGNTLTPNSAFLSLIIPILITFIVGYIIVTFFGMAIQIASIIAVNNPFQHINYFSLIKRGLSLSLSFIGLSIITSFIMLGGLGLFILPGLFFSFIFSMAPYELTIARKSVLDSLRGSMQIVLSNFGGILLRYLVLMVIYFSIMFLLPIFVSLINKNLGAFFNIFSIFTGIGISWFSLSYSITLYEQAATIASPTPKSLFWPVIIATIGYAIIGLIMLIAVTGIIAAFFPKLKTPATPFTPNNYRLNLNPSPSFSISPTTPPTYTPEPTFPIQFPKTQ